MLFIPNNFFIIYNVKFEIEILNFLIRSSHNVTKTQYKIIIF